MQKIFYTTLFATGFAAPLFSYPYYALSIFAVVVFWNTLFPSRPKRPEISLLQSKKPFLAALEPLEDAAPVAGEHCPTCWEELSTKNDPTKLACDHVHCNACILAWIDSGKNTCPVCKKVLFRQPFLQDKEVVLEKAQRLRLSLIALAILLTIIGQISAFIAIHPAKIEHLQWSWDYLNPLSYLTGYSNIFETSTTVFAFTSGFMELLNLRYAIGKSGKDWFKLFPSHWAWLPLNLVAVASYCQLEMDRSSHYAWVAWRICLWRWAGSPGSFLMWGAKIVWEDRSHV